MKIKITAGGIFDGNGKEIPIGHQLTVKEEPKAWRGRYEVIEGGASDEAEFVTNERASIIREAINGLKAETDFTKQGKPDLEAVNTLMPQGAEKVSGAERDAVWQAMEAEKAA
ncbi:hypothetical protein KUV46_15720 [Thalassovita mediterranea]|nr:hypothetical protein KUV46_15720 [Thalassovita mediterranea]